MILITGGLGFIGTHTARALLDLGEPCILGQRRAPGPLPGLLAERPSAGNDSGAVAVVEQVDVTDRAALLALGSRRRITGIVHLAGAATGPDGPIGNARKEVDGLLNVLEAAAEWGVTRVTAASTIGVYGGSSEGPALREDAALPMVSGHAIPAFKKVDELLADYIAAAAGLDVVSARIAGIWGPLGHPTSAFMTAPQLVHAAVHGTAPDYSTMRMPAYGEDGLDLCYVKDCGLGLAALQTADHLNHRVYNVGSGRVTSNDEVAAAVRSVIPEAQTGLLPGGNPDGPASPVYLDITRLTQDTGFKSGYDTERAVADYVAWLQAGNER